MALQIPIVLSFPVIRLIAVFEGDQGSTSDRDGGHQRAPAPMLAPAVVINLDLPSHCRIFS